MKKEFILLLFACNLQVSAIAQYQSLFGEISTSWNIVSEDYLELKWITDSISAGDDTTINLLVYTRVDYYLLDYNSGFPPSFEKQSYIREDLSAGKATNPYLLCGWNDGEQENYHNNPDPFFSGCYIHDTIKGIKGDNPGNERACIF